ALGLIDIEFGWHNVVIARKNDGRLARDQLRRISVETFEPAQLVIELGPRSWIAVRQIEAADEKGADRGFDIAAVCVVGIAGKAAFSFYKLFAFSENGDAIPALLAMPDRAITGFRDRRFWKLLLRCLEFLQADNIGLRGCKPAQEHGQAAVNTIHVVGR